MEPIQTEWVFAGPPSRSGSNCRIVIRMTGSRVTVHIMDYDRNLGEYKYRPMSSMPVKGYAEAEATVKRFYIEEQARVSML